MKNEKEVVIITREQAKAIIEKQDGRFFSVTFKSKDDGSLHKINGRQNVTKYLKKNQKNQDNHEDLKVTFNVKKMAYRYIFLDGVHEIRAGHKIYTFGSR